MAVRIHPTADVSEKISIGEGTSIWHHAQVREGVTIGEKCIIGKGVYVDAGVSIGKHEKKMGIRASHTAQVIFEDVFVPEEIRLGEEGEGFLVAMNTLDHTRAVTAAGAVGVARTVAYAAIAGEISAYRDAAAVFSKSWNAEFAGLQHAEPNAEQATLLDAYQRVKTMLNEFLFHAGNRLAAIRESVNQLSRDPADDAQHHLRQSDAARAFRP